MSTLNKRFGCDLSLSTMVIMLVTVTTLVIAGCDQAENAAKDVADEVGDTAVDAKDAVGDAAKDVGNRLSEGFAAAADKASSALEGIDGGSEMLTKVKDFFGSAQSTLGGITDKASAEAAMSKLGELDGAVDSLGEMTAKLPATAKTALSGVIAQGVKQLKALIDKVVEIPGVSDVIKPKMDELIGKLTSLTK